MARELTPRQADFVAEYLKDLNATQAAIRAGYSAKMAQHLGYQLLQKPPVQAAIAAALAARTQRTQIDADHVLRRLAEQDAADLADIIADDGTVKPISQWPAVWRRGLVAGIEVVTFGNAEKGLGEITKLKLADRMKNLELMGRHTAVGAWRDKVELMGKDGGPVQVQVSAHELTDDELARIAAGSAEG